MSNLVNLATSGENKSTSDRLLVSRSMSLLIHLGTGAVRSLKLRVPPVILSPAVGQEEQPPLKMHEDHRVQLEVCAALVKYSWAHCTFLRELMFGSHVRMSSA